MKVLKYKDPVTGQWKASNAVVKVVGEGSSELVIEPLTVTENGTYTAPNGVDGYSPVSVEVTPDLEELTVTENGEYTPSKDGYSKVTVNVAATATDERFKQLVERTITDISDDTVTSVGDYTFQFCSQLTSVNLPLATSVGSSAFYGCNQLTSVNLPLVTSVGKYAFQSCRQLTSVNLPLATSVGQYAFNSCAQLSCVIFRAETICTLSNANAFKNTPFASGDAGGKLIVPRSLTTEYPNATNWSSVISGNANNRVLALEDYTVDGTITGEIDWDKLNGGTTA